MTKNRESLPLIIGAISVFTSIIILIIFYGQFNETSLPPIQTNPAPKEMAPLKITNPLTGSSVPNIVRIEGILLGKTTDQYIWVIVNPLLSPNMWWPQGSPTPINGIWTQEATIGRPKEDIGKKFYVAVILVDSKDNEDLLNWMESSKVTGNYPSIKFPSNAEAMDSIIVIRQ